MQIRAGALDPALSLARSDQHIARKPCIPPDRFASDYRPSPNSLATNQPPMAARFGYFGIM
jgi:hypothetical protein